jgi:putative transposase
MSRKGTCYDKALIERFWSNLKNEMIHHQGYATRANAGAAIQEHIEISYNRQRRHFRLDYISPALFAEKFSQAAMAA